MVSSLSLSFVFLICSVFLLFSCYGQLCDTGDESSTCFVSSPKHFTENQSFTVTNILITANVTCHSPGCVIEIFTSHDFNVDGGSIEAFDVIVQCGGNASIAPLSQIKVGLNGTLLFSSFQLTMRGRIEGTYINIKIENTFNHYGFISSDGYGFSSSSGPGSGVNGQVNQPGGGGGYGGQGGNPCGLTNFGGSVYGTKDNPKELGSGGGNAENNENIGGSGGGVIWISALSLYLFPNSFITANGISGENGKMGFPNGAGGGSGGSIILQTRVFFQNGGRITANGGDGGNTANQVINNNTGGWGSGGRIYINSSLPLVYDSHSLLFDAKHGYGCNNAIYGHGTIWAFCNPGNEPEQYGCRACSLGSYGNGLAPCVACPSGSFSNSSFAADESSCTVCPAGSVSSVAGSSKCTNCSAGFYAPNGTNCIACDNGSISNSGSSFCSFCGQGMQTVNNACECPINHYIDGTSCLQCPPNLPFSGVNSNSCWNCPRGTYADTVRIGCYPCRIGTYNFDGLGQCYGCSPGSYADKPRSFACTLCPRNTYAPNNSSTGCLPCPEDTVSNQGSSRCIRVPAITTTASQSSFSSYSTSRSSSYSSSSSSYGSKSSSSTVSGTTSIGIGVGVVVGFMFLAVFLAITIRRCNANAAIRAAQYNNNNNNNNYNINTNNVEMSNIRPVVFPVPVPSAPPPEKTPVASPKFPDPIPPPDPNHPTEIGMCVVCYETQRQMIFLPCGHMSTCYSCAKIITSEPSPKCPMCRTPVQSTTHVYL